MNDVELLASVRFTVVFTMLIAAICFAVDVGSKLAIQKKIDRGMAAELILIVFIVCAFAHQWYWWQNEQFVAECRRWVPGACQQQENWYAHRHWTNLAYLGWEIGAMGLIYLWLTSVKDGLFGRWPAMFIAALTPVLLWVVGAGLATGRLF